MRVHYYVTCSTKLRRSQDMNLQPTSSAILAHLPELARVEARRYWEEFGPREALADHCREILRVWAASPFAARICIQYPELLSELFESGDLTRDYQTSEMAERVRKAVDSADSEDALMRCLRKFRRREWLRIAWRDLSGKAELDETLRELSTLAEHCVDSALDWCYRAACKTFGAPRTRAGEQQRLVVLGMGKLGGCELNFSSDIDLIFAYPEEGQTDGARPLDNHQFFVRLGQRLIKVLSESTADGFVFRVDMRLRPFGDVAPLAMGFDAMEQYYQAHGRDWERYALIKARAIAGDRQAGDELLRRLRPFVYRRYLDYGAFGSLRDMKALIDEEVKRRALCNNIKLGPGGIREIEFIAQAFQLLRGGRDSELQRRELQTVLTWLGRRGQLPLADVDKLLAAYRFLRCTENRLQMMDDRQTHDLPEGALPCARLAFAMNYPDWDSFKQDLDGHRHYVHNQFKQIFAMSKVKAEAPHSGAPPALVDLWQGQLAANEALERLQQVGYDEPQQVLMALKTLYAGRAYRAQDAISRKRLDTLMPLLIAAVGACDDAALVLGRILPLIEAIARRSVYLTLLAEHPVALSQLIQLSGASPWIAEYLSRYPVLLDELLDPRDLYAPPDRTALTAQLREEFRHIDPLDTETQMDRLRVFKHTNTLRVAAADVMNALPLMRVSDQLTWIAEVILNHVLTITWRQMVTRYGQPRCEIDGRTREAGFAIIAYGKLGGIELSYSSDLDLVFLHDSAGERQMTDGDKPIDNAVFFVRLTQRLVHALTALTQAGQLYAVDTRLRPSGASGMLVSSIQAFDRYQHSDAWTWEHQALVRARPIAGSARVAERFQHIRAELLAKARDITALRREVREMRARMWRELGGRDPQRFDLKKDPGGITDIEFMVQYCVLAHAHQYPSLSEFTDNIRILDGLAACGLLASNHARFLQDTYRSFRDRVHALSLQGKEAIVDAAEFHEQRAGIKRLWQEMMEK